MKMPKNAFLAAIRAFKPQIGTWNAINAPLVSEVVASTGFDWAVLDMEHSPTSLETAMTQLQAFGGYATAPVVRPPIGDAVFVKRALDIGAPNLLFPMVNTAEEAAALVSYTRYPPNGMRGVARFHRGSRFGRITEYFETVEAQTGVIVQIESRQAVENVEAIASVEGVDGVFFGPADLATDMGYLGNAAEPAMWSVITECSDKVRAIGKPTGTLVASSNHARELFDKGMVFVAVGLDMSILAKGLEMTLSETKGEG